MNRWSCRFIRAAWIRSAGARPAVADEHRPHAHYDHTPSPRHRGRPTGAVSMVTHPPSLTRSLTLRPVVLFGLAYLAPMIVLGTFGVLAEATHGSTPTGYLLALVALLFTALSYGKMSTLFPVAGSAYAYTRRSIDSRVGFLVGWAVLLDYFFLPMVIWLIGAAFLSAKFPGVPTWIWIVAFIVITSALNLIGIKAAANANILLMAFQILVLGIFVALSLRQVFHAALIPMRFSAEVMTMKATIQIHVGTPGNFADRKAAPMSQMTMGRKK